jgi:hypothetical protein
MEAPITTTKAIDTARPANGTRARGPFQKTGTAVGRSGAMLELAGRGRT